jgi:hypothetical protein
MFRFDLNATEPSITRLYAALQGWYNVIELEEHMHCSH